jgi:hypothetical protein
VADVSRQVRLTGQGPNGIEFMDSDGSDGLHLLYRTSPDQLRIENGAGTPFLAVARSTGEVSIGSNSHVRLSLRNQGLAHPTLSGSQLVLAWNRSGGRGETVFYQHGGGGWRSGYDFWTQRDNVGKRLQARIEDTGNLRIRGEYKSLSDAREKANVEPLSDALEKVLRLRGVSFEWADKESRDRARHLGLIAQEVRPILPEVVSGGINEMGEEEPYDLHYDGLIPLLLEAVKEQQRIIDDLSKRISRLEAARQP